MKISNILNAVWRWLAVGTVILAATTVLAQPDTPERQVLDGTWQFRFAADAKAADELRWFFEDGYDASGWDAIPVPSHWALLGYENPRWVNGSEAEGFYVMSFVAPKTEFEMKALLRFGGVWVSAEVWLNGVNLGRHDSGFTEFAYDISGALKRGEGNVLKVRVRQQVPGELFKFDANDDWGLAGIFRSVWIDYYPKDMHIESVQVETDFDEQFRDAALKLRVFVQRNEKDHYLAPSPPFEIRATLLTTEGEEVLTKSYTATVAGAHNGTDVRFGLQVPEPRQWTAETPHLYDLRVELIKGGVVHHEWSDRIGFREVSTEGGVLRVNGKVVKLRGVAHHDLHPDVGRVTRREHWLEDIELMKAANINAVRLAHYPHAEGFIRLCDAMGLYVLNEIPLGFGGDRLGNPIFAAGMYLRIHETIQRDRNRPSVIVWDFGNEDPFSSLHRDGLKAIKGLDATRPVLMPFQASEDLPPEVDILAPHYWTPKEYDALASVARRPIITTEYTHALGPNDFGEMEDRWNALTRHASGAGGMIWLWADQGLIRDVGEGKVLDPMEGKNEYTREGGELVAHSYVKEGGNKIYDAHGNLGEDGIVNPNRTPQRDYWEAKAVYAPVRVMIEEAYLAPGQKSLLVPVYNGYDFVDLTGVEVEWSLLRDADVLDKGTSAVVAGPHMMGDLSLPVEAVDYGIDGVYYAQIAFKREDGTEIGRQSVRLGGKTNGPQRAAQEAGILRVEESDDELSVSYGAVRYAFAKKSGTIESIEVSDKRVVEDSSFAVWRPGTFSERNRLDRRKDGYSWASFMSGLKATATSWKHTQGEDGSLRLETTVEYRYDDKNSVAVDFIYQVDARGVLKIDYTARPTVDNDWIPEVGLSLKLVDAPANIEWLGQGILDSTPGKTAATTFGQWKAPVFSMESRGPKTGIEWARVVGEGGVGFYATGQSAFRLDGVEGKGSSLHLLSRIAGAWTKNGPAERPEWNIGVGEGASFSGSLELTPVAEDPSLAARGAEGPDHPAVLEAGFINPNKTYRECHSASIVDLGRGRMAATWFGGTKERNPDVGIWVALYENGEWADAVEVANGLQADGKRHPSWNSVLFQPRQGPLHLYYKVGPSPGSWWGMLMTSDDGGRSWSKARRLEEPFLGPVKNKPVELSNGDWLAPSSTEGKYDGGWRSHIERSRDQGKTWEFIGPIEPGERGNYMDSIQPSVLVHVNGDLQILSRTKQGHLATSWSRDNGATWEPMQRVDLPHTNSGTDAVTLRDGRHLLVYNHTSGPPERTKKGVRFPLDIALSKDGKRWDRVLTLESEPCGAGYAYPAVIQAADGKVHVVYTWDRTYIKHVVLDPDKL